MDRIDLSTIDSEAFLTDQYSLDFIENNRLIKFAEEADTVHVAFVDGMSPEVAMARLRRHHAPKKVHFCAVESEDLATVLARISAYGEGGSRRLAGENDTTALDRIANDAPIINLVNSLILDALSLKASDIHIEVDGDAMQVRYRVDGSLRIMGRHSIERFPAVSSRIKIMAGLNIMETRRPQDGRITVTIGGREIHLRLSTLPLVRGESIVLRLFNKDEGVGKPETLGLPESTVTALRSVLALPYGLILVTGPTGSGKTTTLSAFLAEISDSSRKIITLEDPVEYILPGVDQVPVREDIGMGFGQLLRRVLRQDPDVIMVGEIRDSETAELAVRAALTGHLVLSTLHTNDAPSAITRLTDMGVAPYLVAAVLRGVLAQRLVRTICPVCGDVRKPESHEVLLATKTGIKLEKTGFAPGCDTCGHTGFSGRTAVSEWFKSDKVLERLIADGSMFNNNSIAQKHLATAGFRPITFDALQKASDGITTIGEIQKAGVF